MKLSYYDSFIIHYTGINTRVDDILCGTNLQIGNQRISRPQFSVFFKINKSLHSKDFNGPTWT